MELRHPYISVQNGSSVSYGGSQTFSESKVMRRCGCGVVAALDFLLYLQRRDKPHSVSFLPGAGTAPMDRSTYISLLDRLSRKYLPLIYPTGINGLVLAAGMNLLFLRERLPFRCVWQVGHKKLWSNVKRMLSQDLPVILAVGPNFPRMFSGKERATLLKRTDSGELVPAAGVLAHYMTVTALEGDWLRLSSWGKEYWLSLSAYEAYAREHSNYVLCNILYVEEK